MISLRDFKHNDANRLVEVLNDSSVNQYLSTKIPTPYTQDDALWWIEEGSRGELIKAITFDNVIVGCIGVNRGDFEYQKSGEIGYWLDSQYWRKGIMLQAIEMMTEQVFSTTDICRIFACVFSSNTPSKQLLLKAGFYEEAVLKNAIFKGGQFYDNHILARLK
ncbi:GNAT family protein [Alteromonas sp. KUL49]|uniref:GNAT family N-acetyltransferase n=1 Tax=Alteromonas sp. KUL49 TaxID=2480798 RepID=UPI00102EEA6C|nr:GNAT family protein [Alteromonas sp. KUL49]TAP35861.1 N-acetyltransferase [Alteromonas sp. KUL49]GEA13242.1 N-acetyltransferase [Alteromonas sp. KUL49]